MQSQIRAALLLVVASWAGNLRAEDQPEALPRVTVFGQALPAKGYTVENAGTATKTDTPIVKTPASVQVVPRAVLEDQAATGLKDALQNVSGIEPQGTLGIGTGFIIRGFQDLRIYRNGLIGNANDAGFQGEYDSANVERVEVLKGPASILFGRIEPGGLINIVTKRPQDTPHYSVQQEIGSFHFYRTEWDATAPVTSERTVLYRLSGAYQNSGSFRDFDSIDRIIVAPSVTFRPNAATELNIEVEGFREHFMPDFGIPAIGNRPAPIPISRSLGDPNTPLSEISKGHAGSDFSYRFNDHWTLLNRILFTSYREDDTFVSPANAFDPGALHADGTLERNIFFEADHQLVVATNLDLVGKFELWRARHEVLAGFDYTHSSTDYRIAGFYSTPNPALAINIFHPHYGIDPALFPRTINTPDSDTSFSVYASHWYGVYFQDQITLFDRLHVLGGGRYDWATTGSNFSAGPTSSFAAANAGLSAQTLSAKKFTPRVGVLYQPWRFLSVYGSWSNSFGASQGFVANTKIPVPPTTGEQYEVGVKSELFDRRLLATLALYDLRKQNILLSAVDPFHVILAGEDRSRGIEFDVSGKITDSLSIIGNYAYTDAKVITATVDVGNRLAGVAWNSGSVWLRYDFNESAPLQGLSLGFGAFAVGDRQGDPDNTYILPGYLRLDSYAAYRFKLGSTKLTAQLNIRNLLDRTYYEQSDQFSNVTPRLGIAPGTPFTAIGSLRVEF